MTAAVDINTAVATVKYSVGEYGVDVAVPNVVVDVDRTRRQLVVPFLGVREPAAQEEGVGYHHLPGGGQPRTLVDGVVVILTVDIDQALHPGHAAI